VKTVLIKDTCHLLQVSFVACSTNTYGFILTHFSWFFPCVIPISTRFHTNRNLHVYYDSFLRHKTDHLSHPQKQPAIPVQILKQFNPPPLGRQSWQLKCSAACYDWCDCSAAAVKWQRTQIPKKGHQLSSCSLTAVRIWFCCTDIDCSSDVLTFALNQACSGKGLLIRHPFKTAPASYLCYVWIFILFFFKLQQCMFIWFDHQSESWKTTF